jgi:hypothetical protein
MSSSDEILDIGETKRQLASIQKIRKLRSIPGADFIVIVEVLGWECIVKKDEFCEGDLVVYFEVDSILPQRPEFEFMRERKFRVKTIKLKKQISQGLVMPITVLHGAVDFISNPANLKEGADVTEILGVTKFDLQAKAERDALMALENQMRQTKVPKWLMNISAFRYIYFKLNPKIKGNWPSWIQKTDESRIQSSARKLMEHYDKAWYVTEKLDGQSATYFTYHKKSWGMRLKKFGVGSREVWRKTEDNSSYWSLSRKYDLKNKMMEIVDLITVQGEAVGPGIQKNKYKLEDYEFFVFNILVDGKRLTPLMMGFYLKKFGLKMVPIVRDVFVPAKEFGAKETHEVIKELVEMSKGDSVLFKRKREGLVFRLVDNPSVSFKVINPEFSLEEDKAEDS